MIALRVNDKFTGKVVANYRALPSKAMQTFSRMGITNTVDPNTRQATENNNIMTFGQKSQGRQLFENFVSDLSNVSTRFSDSFRATLTRQFKELVSEDSWEAGDTLPVRGAFSTLFRVLSITGAKRPPSLGANGAGSLTASWFKNEDRLTLDCLDRDRVIFVLQRRAADEAMEGAAGETRTPLLPAKLRPYNPEVWFN